MTDPRKHVDDALRAAAADTADWSATTSTGRRSFVVAPTGASPAD